MDTDLADQTAVGPHCIAPLNHHPQISHASVNTGQRHVAVDAVDDLSVSASADQFLPPSLLDLDGGEDELAPLPLPLRNVLKQRIYFKPEQILG